MPGEGDTTRASRSLMVPHTASPPARMRSTIVRPPSIHGDGLESASPTECECSGHHVAISLVKRANAVRAWRHRDDFKVWARAVGVSRIASSAGSCSEGAGRRRRARRPHAVEVSSAAQRCLRGPVDRAGWSRWRGFARAAPGEHGEVLRTAGRDTWRCWARSPTADGRLRAGAAGGARRIGERIEHQFISHPQYSIC